jgi:hypothetical protein
MMTSSGIRGFLSTGESMSLGAAVPGQRMPSNCAARGHSQGSGI